MSAQVPPQSRNTRGRAYDNNKLVINDDQRMLRYG